MITSVPLQLISIYSVSYRQIVARFTSSISAARSLPCRKRFSTSRASFMTFTAKPRCAAGKLHFLLISTMLICFGLHPCSFGMSLPAMIRWTWLPITCLASIVRSLSLDLLHALNSPQNLTTLGLYQVHQIQELTFLGLHLPICP